MGILRIHSHWMMCGIEPIQTRVSGYLPFFILQKKVENKLDPVLEDILGSGRTNVDYF